MYGLRWQSFPLPTAGEIAGLVAPLGLPKGDVATPLLTRGCAAVAKRLAIPELVMSVFGYSPSAITKRRADPKDIRVQAVETSAQARR